MNEEHLIFLISQPRSGSSMFQQLLLSTGEIDTVPESWMMLALIGGVLPSSDHTSFNRKYTAINFSAFLEENRLQPFFQNQIKQTALKMYGEIKRKQFFLDKTPRYYHIIKELRLLFPNAKYIFLVRNPLSVFTSILTYNFHGNLSRMTEAPDRMDDLYLAPEVLANEYQFQKKNSFFVKYEHLVNNPESISNEVAEYLRMAEIDLSHYSVAKQFTMSNAVDKKSVHLHNSPVNMYMNSWKENISTYAQKEALLNYILNIDRNYLEIFDYDREELISQVSNLKVQMNMKSQIKRKISWLKKL